MKDNHKIALYVAYYLAKYNKDAIKNLGFHSWNNAFEIISEKLDINVNSVKNWRDEFDPLFGHRAGWHQRAMTVSRVRVAQALEHLSEYELRNIVIDIISGDIYKNEDQLIQLLNVVLTKEENKTKKLYLVRNPTGRAAEELFVKYHLETSEPLEGNLIDVRDLGVGYDFKLETINDDFFIEVKGIASDGGGILLTEKEWSVAQNKQDQYFLCIVSNVNETPEFKFIQNPMQKLQPQKYIYTSININWLVSSSELKNL